MTLNTYSGRGIYPGRPGNFGGPMNGGNTNNN